MTATATAEPSATTGSSGAGGFLRGWSWQASLFLAPALFLLAVFMLYPTVSTIILSFENGLDNDARVDDFSANLDPSGFTPAALRARGTR